MSSDDQIIKRVLRGHTGDFSGLMDKYQGAVYRIAYRVLGRREEAEDAVQETFLRVYQNLSSCRDTTRFWPWTRRITLNLCLSRIPREFPSEDVCDMADSLCVGLHPTEAEVLRCVAAEAAARAVQELPALYRTVVVLRYMEDLSCSEIGEMLDRPAGTVRAQLHRALRMLSDRLAGVRDEV